MDGFQKEGTDGCLRSDFPKNGDEKVIRRDHPLTQEDINRLLGEPSNSKGKKEGGNNIVRMASKK